MMTVWERIQAGQHIVFAEIIGAEVPDDCPVERITYLYGHHFQPGPGGEPVDLEHLAKSVKKVNAPNNIVAIDLEDERVSGLTTWGAGLEHWEEHGELAKQVIATIREAQPEWKLGWFGRLPYISTRNTNGFHAHQGDGSQGQRHEEYLRVVELYRFHREVSDLLDWYHPDLYLGFWDWKYAYEQNDSMRWLFDNEGVTSPILEAQDCPLKVWQDVVHVAVNLIRSKLAPRPLIPAASPQWWIYNMGAEAGIQKPQYGQHSSMKMLQRQLDTTALHCDGTVLWCKPEMDGWTPGAFLESDRWKIICEFAEKQKQKE